MPGGIRDGSESSAAPRARACVIRQIRTPSAATGGLPVRSRWVRRSSRFCVTTYVTGRTLWVPRVDYRMPLAVCSYESSDRDATVVVGSGTRMLKMRNSPVAKYVHLSFSKLNSKQTTTDKKQTDRQTLQVRATRSSDEAVTPAGIRYISVI